MPHCLPLPYSLPDAARIRCCDASPPYLQMWSAQQYDSGGGSGGINGQSVDLSNYSYGSSVQDTGGNQWSGQSGMGSQVRLVEA
mmetsp:Transcript_13888/g.35091  ORF Transcript_13888/g.35091 Transcript_13888/m.35091 type:complete len:84 (+) Transcript_13888:75-326(+)